MSEQLLRKDFKMLIKLDNKMILHKGNNMPVMNEDTKEIIKHNVIFLSIYESDFDKFQKGEKRFFPADRYQENTIVCIDKATEDKLRLLLSEGKYYSLNYNNNQGTIDYIEILQKITQ